MMRRELSLFSAEEFAVLPPEWDGDILLLANSVPASPEACDRIRTLCAAGVTVIIHDLASPAMTRFIPQEDEKLQLGFQRFLREQCEKISTLGVKEFSLRFDMERAAGDALFCEELKRILRMIGGLLEEFRLRLLLTVQLPAESAADGVWLAQFRQDLLLPSVGFLVELYGADETPLEPVRFYADRILKTAPDTEVSEAGSDMLDIG